MRDVLDANSNPISGATVSLAQDGSSTISAVTDNNDGTYTFTVNSTTAETVNATPRLLMRLSLQIRLR